MIAKLLTTITLTLFLLGCNDTPIEEIKTVEYYQQNKEEHKAKLKECKNNIGELGQTPNCQNAFQTTKENSSGQLTPSNWGKSLNKKNNEER